MLIRLYKESQSALCYLVININSLRLIIAWSLRLTQLCIERLLYRCITV